MNKKVKILASVLCGLVLSSGLALTNVQAKSTTGNVATTHSIQLEAATTRSYTTYTTYATLSYENVSKICNYLNASNATASGLICLMQQNNMVPFDTANTVGLRLYGWGGKTLSVINNTYERGLRVLQTKAGTYTIVAAYPDENFEFVLKLSDDSVQHIINYMRNSNPTVNEFQNYMQQNYMHEGGREAGYYLYYLGADNINTISNGSGIRIMKSANSYDFYEIAPNTL